MDVALYNLPNIFDGNFGVVLRLALDLFGLLTDFLPGSPDVLVGFKVSLVGSRGREVNVEPFRPGALFGYTDGSGFRCVSRAG